MARRTNQEQEREGMRHTRKRTHHAGRGTTSPTMSVRAVPVMPTESKRIPGSSPKAPTSATTRVSPRGWRITVI